MEVIILGLRSESEKELLDKKILEIDGIDIVWDYEKYTIESAVGIELLKTFYDLQYVGIVVENNWEESFTSYPLIDEITEYFINESQIPKLFNFLDALSDIKINNLILAFADEWDKETLVRIKKINSSELKNYICNIHSWYEVYVDMNNNEEIREGIHPLILEIDCT